MSDDLIKLSRRAVACRGWRLIGGMRYRLHPTHPWFRFDGEYCFDGLPVPQAREATPDLSDPATVGCLLALVRKAWGIPSLSLSPWQGGWDFAWAEHDSTGPCGYWLTEAEALVAALEGAP
jgi:hypothetical protein